METLAALIGLLLKALEVAKLISDERATKKALNGKHARKPK